MGESASRAIAVVLLDFVFVKLGCYFLNIQGSSQVVDLIAYGGYKFVGYAISLLASRYGCAHAPTQCHHDNYRRFSRFLWPPVDPCLHLLLPRECFLPRTFSQLFYIFHRVTVPCFTSFDHYAPSFSLTLQYLYRQTQTLQRLRLSTPRSAEGESPSCSLKLFYRFFIWLPLFVFELDFRLMLRARGYINAQMMSTGNTTTANFMSFTLHLCL